MEEKLQDLDEIIEELKAKKRKIKYLEKLEKPLNNILPIIQGMEGDPENYDFGDRLLRALTAARSALEELSMALSGEKLSELELDLKL